MIFYSFGKRVKNLIKVKIISILKSRKPSTKETYSKKGTVVFYYPSGKIKAECTYHNNELEGISKHYYEDGKLRAKENYKKGKLYGISKYYYKNGSVEFEKYFKNGNIIYSNYYDNDGNLKNKN